MSAINSVKYLITESRSTSPVSKLVGELHGAYGVNMTKELSSPGYLTLSIRMKNPYMTSAEILDLTKPLRRSIWVYVNGSVLWAGFILSRVYESEAHSMQISAVTFDGWYDQIYFSTAGSLDVTDSAHRNLNRCFTAALDPNLNYLDYRAPTELGMPGLPAVAGSSFRLQIPAASMRVFRQVMNTCIDAGAEYRVITGGNIFGTSGRATVVELGHIQAESTMVGKSSSEITAVYDYPGVISKYWWPESCAASQPVASYLIHTGRAENGDTGIFSLGSTWAGEIPTEYIGTMRIPSIRNAATATDGGNMASRNYKTYRPPLQRPTFEVELQDINTDFPFGLDVGDFFKYTITDPYRFPNTRMGKARCAGWSFSPPGSDNPAQLGITVDDAWTTITQSGE